MKFIIITNHYESLVVNFIIGRGHAEKCIENGNAAFSDLSL